MPRALVLAWSCPVGLFSLSMVPQPSKLATYEREHIGLVKTVQH
jgi:hypothetical protein